MNASVPSTQPSPVPHLNPLAHVREQPSSIACGESSDMTLHKSSAYTVLLANVHQFIVIPFGYLEIGVLSVYHLAFFHMPDVYARVIAAAANNPSQHSALAPAIIKDWKKFSIISGALLSIVLGMFQLQGAADRRTDVQTAGFVCLACAFVSFVISFVLLIAFGTFHVEGSRTVSPAGDNNSVTTETTDLERQQGPSASSTSNCHLFATLFNDGDPVHGFWNKYVLVALPAVWTVWSGISFILFFLLFVWNFSGSTMGPDNNIPRSVHSSAPTDAIAQMALAKSFIPGIAATIVLTLGGVYIVLIIRELRLRA